MVEQEDGGNCERGPGQGLLVTAHERLWDIIAKSQNKGKTSPARHPARKGSGPSLPRFNILCKSLLLCYYQERSH